MSAVDLLRQAEAAGVQVWAVGDKLRYFPKNAPPDLVALLREHKPELLSHLQQDTANPFECWVLEEWRRVSIPHWRTILQEAWAQGDKKREAYARWMLAEVLQDIS